MNELKIFNNEEFGEVRTVLNSDGGISINAEDIVFGLGWTTVATSGNEVGRWSRVNTYCKELGFDKEITFYLGFFMIGHGLQPCSIFILKNNLKNFKKGIDSISYE